MAALDKKTQKRFTNRNDELAQLSAAKSKDPVPSKLRISTWLAGSKTRLRPIELADVGLLNRWRITSRRLRRLNAQLPRNKRAIEEWVAKTAIDPDTRAFIIESLGSEDIGTMALTIHESRAVLEVSIWNPRFWNRGYDEDAVKVVVDGAFRVLPLTRIELLVFTNDLRAIRRFEAAGFNKEGVLRDYEYARGRAHDMLLMSILHEEWKQEGPR